VATSVQANQLAKSGKYGDLRRRLFFLLGALVVFRLGSYVPVPGIDPAQMRALFEQQSGGILSLFNMFSGGALSRFSIMALGIMPYISASIIMQLMTYVVPSLEALKKEGEAGKRKITQYTRYGTLGPRHLPVARHRAGPGGHARPRQLPRLRLPHDGGRQPGRRHHVLMWLGEQITERGLGNGISILIFAGIAAGLPSAIGQFGTLVTNGSMSIVVALGILLLVVAVTFAVVFVERGQRKILVNYAKRQVGQQGLRRAVVAPAAEAEHVGRDPADLRLVDHPAAGDRRQLVRDRRQPALAEGPGGLLAPGQPIYVMLYAARSSSSASSTRRSSSTAARRPTT
jgi:preprotein translocase subunit SecY